MLRTAVRLVFWFAVMLTPPLFILLLVIHGQMKIVSIITIIGMLAVFVLIARHLLEPSPAPHGHVHTAAKWDGYYEYCACGANAGELVSTAGYRLTQFSDWPLAFRMERG